MHRIDRFVLGLALGLSTIALRSAAEEEMNPVDASLLLEDEDLPPSPEAVRSLARHGGGLGVSSLLKVLDRVGPEERRTIAESFRGPHALQDRVLDALYRLAWDEDPGVRQAAIQSLEKSELDRAPQMLVTLLKTGHPDREALARAIHSTALARRSSGTTQSEAIPFEEQASGRLSLLLASALSAILGFFLFLWAFRLLKLRALLEGTGLSKARSIALGTAAVCGEAQTEGDYLRHPYTGEICVWYRGAEKHHPERRFWMEDDTGRLLVDPRGAVLLSEDGVISPGERIHIVGVAKGSSEAARLALAKNEAPRPLHQRLVDLVVGGLFGVVAGDRSVRRLFDNHWTSSGSGTMPAEDPCLHRGKLRSSSRSRFSAVPGS